MLIVFDSRTGNVKRFVSKLGMRSVQITESLTVNEPFVLITFTTGVGQVPQTTLDFLEKHHHILQAVATSGNMNWGSRYGMAANVISQMYDVPIMMKFELSGRQSDVDKFKQEVSYLGNQYSNQYSQVDTA